MTLLLFMYFGSVLALCPTGWNHFGDNQCVFILTPSQKVTESYCYVISKHSTSKIVFLFASFFGTISQAFQESECNSMDGELFQFTNGPSILGQLMMDETQNGSDQLKLR